jgi:hypothetical protein
MWDFVGCVNPCICRLTVELPLVSLKPPRHTSSLQTCDHGSVKIRHTVRIISSHLSKRIYLFSIALPSSRESLAGLCAVAELKSYPM